MFFGYKPQPEEMDVHRESPTAEIDWASAAPMTNIAEYGFEGRFEEWTDNARYSSTPRPPTRLAREVAQLDR